MTTKEKLDSLDWQAKYKYIFDYGVLLAEKDLDESVKGLLFTINSDSSESLAVEIQIIGNMVISIIDGPVDNNPFVSKYVDELGKLLE